MYAPVDYNKEEHVGNSKNSWRVGRVFRKLDQFGREVPAFNLNGEKKVKTFIGGVITVGCICLLILFAASKLTELLDRQYPSVQDISTQEYFIGGEDKFNLSKAGYRIAFTFEARDGKRLDDPRYVKSLVRLRQQEDGVGSYQRLLEYHECT